MEAGNDSVGTIRTLQLKVQDEKIVWVLWDSSTKDVRNGDVDLGLSGVEQRTIEFLRDVLHHSTDVALHDRLEESMSSRLLTVLGEHLYQLLFHGDLRTILNNQLKDLHSGKVALLRLDLEFQGRDAEWMAGLPWEYLHPPKDPEENAWAGGQFLATLATQLFLNRQLSIDPDVVRALPTPSPVKVLLVSASPRSTDGMELQAVDYRPVKEALRNLGKRITLEELVEGRPELTAEWRPTVTREHFRKVVRDFKPNIIHFVGHGQRKSGGHLAFMGRNGEPDWVDDRTFANLAAASPQLKLVFLQACESALPDPYVGVSGVAREVAKFGIPAVVAMQYKVEQGVANTFAGEFYCALAAGEPVDVAVKAGRETLSELENQPTGQASFGLPVLYLRSYDGMIVREESPRGTGLTEITTEAPDEDAPTTCVRCGVALLKASQRACTNCGLRFVCPDCRERYLDPFGNFCACGHPLVQRDWKPVERIETAPRHRTAPGAGPRTSRSGPGVSLRDAAAAEKLR